jgi:hypothetical protein
MVWAILALLGVPIWLCAVAILVLVLRNRSLRKRTDDVPARMRSSPKKRWTRGHGLWVHDVWSFRGSPAAWNERLIWVTEAALRQPTDDEAKKLRRLGGNPIVATFRHEGGSVDVACASHHRSLLLGPFESILEPSREGVSRPVEVSDVSNP